MNYEVTLKTKGVLAPTLTPMTIKHVDNIRSCTHSTYVNIFRLSIIKCSPVYECPTSIFIDLLQN